LRSARQTLLQSIPLTPSDEVLAEGQSTPPEPG
jgi:hypothetical protein